MENRVKVLILSASYGDGHVQVSRALQNRFREKGIRQVKVVDLFTEAHPVINSFVRYMYIKSFSLAPYVYGWLYHRTQTVRHDSLFWKLLNLFGIRKLQEILAYERPDLVINTFPTTMMTDLKQKLGIPIPVCTVITDFTLHYRWIHPATDKYFVPTEDIRNQLIQLGIPEQRVVVSGIPLRKEFESSTELGPAHEQFGLHPDAPIILVMAGAYGVLQNIRHIIESMLSAGHLQIALVCGKNQTLKDEMEAAFGQLANVKIYGFVENIHDLMRISDLIVTKPGGVTLSEALAVNLPVVLCHPVPGQEADNARYLANLGVALIIDGPETVTQRMLELLRNPQHLQRMRRAMQSLQQKNATDTIVNHVLKKWTSIGTRQTDGSVL